MLCGLSPYAPLAIPPCLPIHRMFSWMPRPAAPPRGRRDDLPSADNRSGVPTRARWAASASLCLFVALAAPAAAQVAPNPGPGQSQEELAPALSTEFLEVDFGYQSIVAGSSTTQIQFTNQSLGRIVVQSVQLTGPDAADFAFHVGRGAFALAPGQSRAVRVGFLPNQTGPRSAQLELHYAQVQRGQLPPAPTVVPLYGIGVGAPGEEVAMNLSGIPLVDSSGKSWSTFFGLESDCVALGTFDPIVGTVDDALYQGAHEGDPLAFSLPLGSGEYEVVLHLCEVEHESAGARVMEVLAEGAVLEPGLDPFALAGHDVALQVSLPVTVLDGVLDLELRGLVDDAILNALEVRSAAIVDPTPGEVDFGSVSTGGSAQVLVDLDNLGPVAGEIQRIEFDHGASGNSADFTVSLGGVDYAGGVSEPSYVLSEPLAPGGQATLTIAFAPTDETYDVFDVVLGGNFADVRIEVSGLGGHEGHPFLHIVAEVPELVVDYDGDGSEDVLLNGVQSHTHEPGQALIGHHWTEGGQTLASQPLATVSFPLGTHTIDFAIEDDNVPAESIQQSFELEVVPASAIPGVRARYFQSTPGGASGLLDSVPMQPDFAEVLADFALASAGSVGSSDLTTDVLVVIDGDLDVALADTWDFSLVGGVDTRLFVDGGLVIGPLALTAGTHSIEARWAIDSLSDLPLDLLASIGGAPSAALDPNGLQHNEVGMAPVLNSMSPAVGSALGGNQIELRGLGFFPSANVEVHWGATVLDSQDFLESGPDFLRFESPAGTGTLQVSVQTPNGESNPRTFSYDDNAPVPIAFKTKLNYALAEPTGGAWGPDGRFYVVQRSGHLVAFTFDDDYNILAADTYDGVSANSSPTALGIAFNPHDSATPVRVYVSHSLLFAQGGGSFTGPSPYPGRVSVLEGPDFDTPLDLISGLPVSNHDHAIFGLEFDHDGNLYICAGSNTNAGVIHPNSGDLNESPLTAAILRAPVGKPGFNGQVTYVHSVTGLPSDDQVEGHDVDVAPGVDVELFSVGVRNPYDVVFTMSKRLYGSDNGPNFTFGDASTGPDTQGPDPQTPDELNLYEYGQYYGHPNRNRGRYDARQNIYHGHSDPSEPGVFHQGLIPIASSHNGITEYRAEAFAGALKNQLLVQRWSSYLRRVKLSADGRSVVEHENIFPWTGALGIEVGPGGALMATDQAGNFLRILVPNDLAVDGLTPYDVTPWRAPRTGGHMFTIGGIGFGTLADTSVTFDGIPASLSMVSATRIVGLIPAHPTASQDLVDVMITVAGEASVLEDSFRYLHAPGEEQGDWDVESPLPLALGEVAAGAIDGSMFVVGQGYANTLAFDFLTETWSTGLAQRPLVGDHHAAEVIDGKLYLVGGLGGGSEGALQIYDPVADSWSQGSSLPWAAGSVQTTVIQGLLYAAGGIVGGNTTVDDCAVYDPLLDSWTPLASMPTGKGRNHAAAGTDGARFWIFGGRGEGSGPGNWVTNGFADVQVYDPLSDSWDASYLPGSALLPLPQERGGTGKAVYSQGEFYIFGGETASAPGATPDGVFARVDVYDPLAHSWRAEKPLPTPRQGMHPLLFASRIWTVGGGVAAGYSQSSAVEIFRRN